MGLKTLLWKFPAISPRALWMAIACDDSTAPKIDTQIGTEWRGTEEVNSGWHDCGGNPVGIRVLFWSGDS